MILKFFPVGREFLLLSSLLFACLLFSSTLLLVALVLLFLPWRAWKLGAIIITIKTEIDIVIVIKREICKLNYNVCLIVYFSSKLEYFNICGNLFNWQTNPSKKKMNFCAKSNQNWILITLFIDLVTNQSEKCNYDPKMVKFEKRHGSPFFVYNFISHKEYLSRACFFIIYDGRVQLQNWFVIFGKFLVDPQDPI